MNWISVSCRVLLLANVGLLRGGEVQLTISDEAGERMPCRIHLRDATGKIQRPAGYVFWNDHFVCDGSARLELTNGVYSFTVKLRTFVRAKDTDGRLYTIRVSAADEAGNSRASETSVTIKRLKQPPPHPCGKNCA